MNSATRLTGEQALARLTDDCHFPEEKARRILNIAWEFENKAEPCPGGYVHVFYHGQPRGLVQYDARAWSVVEHIGPVTRQWPGELGMASPSEKAYTEQVPSKYTSGKARTMKRRSTMPPRRNAKPAAAPEPEVAEQNGSRSKLDNVANYLERKITPTLADYYVWFGENVADPDKLDSERLMFLAVTFYGEFQASDFNREQKAARKAEREAAAPEPEEEAEPEPATPKRRGARGAAKPAAAKPAAARPGRKPAAAGSSRSKAAVY